MPNWCFNQLTVCGVIGDVSTFVSENKGTRVGESLSFNARVPRTRENGADWGCKWDARDSDVYVDSDGKSAEYSFTTPWAPPEDWLLKVSEQYPNLRFTLCFDEESNAFRGETVVKNGIKDEESSLYEEDYECSDDDLSAH